MSDKQQPDKTGARHPNLKPEEQGATQEQANKAGDLRDPENVRDLHNIARDVPGDDRELGDMKMGEHDPPEAAELGGAKTSPEASGQKSGGGGEAQNKAMQQATSRENRDRKPGK